MTIKDQVIPLTLATQGCENIHPEEVVRNISYKDIQGVKILFINMPLREQAWPPTTTPEGPLLMMTRLRDEYGAEVHIIDLNAYRKENPVEVQDAKGKYRYYTTEETFDLIRYYIAQYGHPDIVAFSGMITTLYWQEVVAKMIRKILPDVFLVSGGGLATDLQAGLLSYIPELNAITLSEGDDVIIKIAYDAKLIRDAGWENSISSGHLKPYYIGQINNQHKLIYKGSRPKDLNTLPFADLNLLEPEVLERYLGMAKWGIGSNNSSAAPFTMKRSTTSVSTRGCPHACTYCDRTATGGRLWGAISADHLAELLLRNIGKYGIDFHGWCDDNMPVDRHRIASMVPLIKPLGIRWGTHGRLDEISGLRPNSKTYEDPLRVRNMAEAGCIYIGAGPESASVKVLETIGKGGHTLKNGLESVKVDGESCEFPFSMTEGIRQSLRYGIHVNCTWIMLSPTETLQDLQHTVRFIRWQDEFYATQGVSPEAVNKRMFTMTFYPGTELVQQPKVRSELARAFGITFDPKTNRPVIDKHFHDYCLQLDDATKLLVNPTTGEPINFSEIPNDIAMQAREYVDSGNLYKILDM